MGKFGHKNTISDDLSDYMIGLLGESGIGKSTLMVEVASKLYGDEGYIVFDMGKESGMSAIDEAVYETIPDWKKFEEVVKDIVKNKATDYPNLKVVIIDTLDQALAISTTETIRRWNAENANKKNFEPAKTLGACWGGFSGPLDYNVNLILDKIWQLKSVGVQVWIVGHVKTKDIVDPVTGATYTTLTTDVSQRDFNAFKNKLHVVGIAYIDRTIEAEDTGRKNIITHKAIEINKVKNEVRRISFRDDTYSVDSKSRFANIVSDIPMDADAFIKAIKDAIQASKKSPAKKEETPVVKPTPVPVAEPEPVEENVEPEIQEENFINPPEEVPEDEYPDNLEEVIRTEFKKCKDAALKAQIKNIISEHGGKLNVVDEDGLKEIYDLLCR